MPGAVALAPGTYAVGVSGQREGGFTAGTLAGFAKFEGACNATPSAGRANPASGTVTVSAASPAGLKGTFDLQFLGGRLTGSFDVPVCGDVAFLNATSSANCVNNPPYCSFP